MFVYVFQLVLQVELKLLLDILLKTFNFEPLEAIYYREKTKNGQILDLQFIRLEFVKQISMSDKNFR